MAPITRNSALVSASLPSSQVMSPGYEGTREGSHEASWQLPEPDVQSERDMSEEPASSYDEAELLEQNDGALDQGDEKENLLQTSKDHEDLLHPLRDTAERVGREVERFAEVLDRYNPLRIFPSDDKLQLTSDLLEKYHEIALETVSRLREQHDLQRKQQVDRQSNRMANNDDLVPNADKMDTGGPEADLHASVLKTTVKDIERWEEEAQTWDLLRRLVHVRYSYPDGRNKSTRHLHQYSSERDIWTDFVDSDGLAKEQKVIMQWLKDTAEENGDDIDVLVKDLQQNADRGDIVAHGWLHTKETIKKYKRLHVWTDGDGQSRSLMSTKNERIVTHLDPDAPNREGHKLEAQDESFERAIWLGCYHLLRRGKSPAFIKEWCNDRTEAWRALSMSGFQGENVTDGTDGADVSNRMLWKRMCLTLARQGGSDDHERAVYGLLSGDVQSVEPVCQTWDDVMFVHLNAFLQAQFASHVQALYSQRIMAGSNTVFSAMPAPANPTTAIAELIKSLRTESRTAEEAQRFLKTIQGVLIANTFDNYIYNQGLALSEHANRDQSSKLLPPFSIQSEDRDTIKYVNLDDHDGLRVLAHVLLVFVSLGYDFGGALRMAVIENCMVSYVGFLRLAGKEELIPLYCSQLSGMRRYSTLCRSLIDVVDKEHRLTQIKLIREFGMDVQEFVKLQTQYLFNDYPKEVEGYPATNNFKILVPNEGYSDCGLHLREDFIGEDIEKLDRVDLLLIRSLEWFLLVDGLWSETFQFGTMMYMRFFKHMNLQAARLLALTVSCSLISTCKTLSILGESLDLFVVESEREDEEYTEILSGSGEKKMLIKHLIAEGKSFQELQMLIVALDNIETIAEVYSIFQTETLRKGWRQELAKEFHPTHVTVPPLLKGWLVTRQDDDGEFRLLREAYLPETILAYVNILQFVGEKLTRELLLECMDLAAIVAAENCDLQDLFVKAGRMGDLVKAFALASKTLLVMSSTKQGARSKSKKLRAKGWTHELWSIDN